MHRVLLLGVVALMAAGLCVTGCDSKASASSDNEPTRAPSSEPPPKAPADTPKADPNAAQDEIAAKAMAFLKTMYNVAPDRSDRQGIKSGWGPKSFNIPYTAMILDRLYGTKAWDASSDMIKDRVTFLVDNQEPSGGFSFMPLSITPNVKGMQAVYITSIVAQLFVQLNDEGAWKGKLNDAVAKARDCLKQAQVGSADGPAKDYKKEQSGYGGWAYSKEELAGDKKPASNMSTSAFAIDALKACGVDQRDPLWEAALVFLKRNQNAGEVQDEGFAAMDSAGKKIKPSEKGSEAYGGAVYSESSSQDRTENADGTVTLGSYGSMTYNLLRAYLFAGLAKDSVPVKLAFGWLQRNYTVKRVPGFRDEKAFENGLYYYYASMSRTLQVWGSDTIEEADRGTKHDWRADLVAELKARQKTDGSWVNDKSAMWRENSPVLCTAYALDALKHTRK